MASAAPNPVVLVHGAWHGAWCFAALQDALDRRGVPSYAVDLPGHGASTLPLSDMHGDARHVAEVLAAIGRPAVVVGHSYGGAVITQAAALHETHHLVYLAAFALEAGESIASFNASGPRYEVRINHTVQRHEDGTSTLVLPDAIQALYGDCPPEAVSAAAARLGRQPLVTFAQAVDATPTVPRTYVTCLRDEAIHPDQQRVMAQRCGREVVLDTDHSPFLSATDAVADLLAELAS
jgi:pimeloyl-ACP methyl ester carboxylesterase